MFVPPRYTETDARIAIAASQSWAEALRKLGMRAAGGNWKTLRRYVHDVWDISTGTGDRGDELRGGGPEVRRLGQRDPEVGPGLRAGARVTPLPRAA
jgi:hypothetical protein